MFRRGWIGPRSALIFCVFTLACNACYQMTGDSLQAFDLLVRGLTGFAGGAFLYRAISGGKDHKFSRGWCAAALAIFVLTATDAIPRAFLSLAALPLVYQLSLWQTASGRWTHFSRSWGNLSYAIYLLHLPLMKLILFLLLVTGITSSQLFHALWELKMAYIGGTLLIVLGCSLLSYYFLERPARNAVRRALLKA
jgi:peptidoglycan/LPS O-acetylase OafA/YrhL